MKPAGIDLPGVLQEQADLSLAALDVETGELVGYFASARGSPGTPGAGTPGTALLPFIYLAAFSRGYTPASMLLDLPPAGASAQAGSSQAESFDGAYLGPLQARTALQKGRVVPTVQLIERMGADTVLRTLGQVGIEGLGSGSVSPPAALLERGANVSLLELMRAYAVLAASGVDRIGPSAGPAVILWVEDERGQRLEAAAGQKTTSIVSSGLTFLLQDILSDESYLQALPQPPESPVSMEGAALGRSQDGSQGWAFAFNSHLVLGVLVTEQRAAGR